MTWFADLGGGKVLLVILAVGLLVYKCAAKVEDDLLNAVILSLFGAAGIWQAGTVVQSRTERKIEAKAEAAAEANEAKENRDAKPTPP